ncbi:MAG: HAMP domain-containing histidine kinase [Actinomycetota bacterium]|nr:HAMP domain-containing histidine kinase [Actinomycetota bacterium]
MRRRITWLAIVVSAVAVVLFAVPLAVAVARYLTADERGELQRGATTIAAAVSGDLSRGRALSSPHTESGQQVAVYDTRGRRISGDGPPTVGPLAKNAIRGTADTGRVSGRLAAAVPVSDGDTITGAVLVIAARDQLNHRILLAWTSMLALAASAVGASALLARAYARRLSGPVEALARTADRVGGGEFTARASLTGVAELDTLAAAMNRSAERISDMMQRERAFSADASHQLRTPLTGLRLQLEAALANAAEDERSAIEDALGTADRLDNTITALLALARDTSSTAAVAIEELITVAGDRWRTKLAQLNRPLRVVSATSPDKLVLCSRPAVEQILDVLLDNATRHGRGAVTITVRDLPEATAIDVADEGPPLLVEPTSLFRRRADGAQDHGIGLALARTLAEADGGRLILTRAQPPTFTLLLRDRLVPGEPGDGAVLSEPG